MTVNNQIRENNQSLTHHNHISYFTDIQKEKLHTLWPTGNKSVLADIALVCSNNNKLMECLKTNIKSVYKCASALCTLKLSVNPNLQLAYLIPYKNECTLYISYMGLIQLTMRNPEVSHISAFLIKENEPFKIKAGSTPSIEHEIILNGSNKIIGSYALVHYTNGNVDFEVLDLTEIEKCREASKNMQNTVWNNFFGEMAKKCAIRRLLKRIKFDPAIMTILNEIENNSSSPVPKNTSTIKSQQSILLDKLKNNGTTIKDEAVVTDRSP